MNYIKRKLKLFFRNKSITTLLILGLLVSYFIVINGVAMLNSITEEQNKSMAEEYKNEKKFILAKYIPEVTATDKVAIFESRFENTIKTLGTGKGNLMLKGHGVNVGAALKGVYADVIYSLEDKLNKKIVSGRMPLQEEITSKEKVALVSRDMEKYIEKKDNILQIQISDIVYKVTGIFETNDISSTRADIVLFMDSFTDEEIKIMANRIKFVAVSYSGNISEADYQELLQKVKRNGEIADENIENNDSENKNRILFNKIFMIILFVFSLINCMVISNVWINSRFRELVIRKTIGYSVMQVVGLLISDLLKYSCISVGLAIVFQTVISKLLMENSMSMKYSINNTIYLVVSLGIIVALSLVVPIIKLKKLLPARKVNG